MIFGLYMARWMESHPCAYYSTLDLLSSVCNAAEVCVPDLERVPMQEFFVRFCPSIFG